MSEKLRSVNTRFWDDAYIQGLTPTDKLLFLYLLTNTLTNLIGIYEITQKRMEFDTGIGSQMIRKGLERFERDKKVFYVDGYIILPNFLRHQNLNTNMQIGAVKLFNSLPNYITDRILNNGSEGLPNDYQTIRNGMLNMNRNMNGNSEVEVEFESELKVKREKVKRPPVPLDVADKNFEENLAVIKLLYKIQWDIAKTNRDGSENYITRIVKAIEDRKLTRIAALEDHITVEFLDRWLKLCRIDDIIDTMEAINFYPDFNYVSLKTTLTNWLKKDYAKR